ncbi:MAG: hypothetical protein ACLP0L_03900 [Solirubrobacteraceae bacterium]
MCLPRPSAPLAVSFLALFVALGGVSWAAIHIPPNSVGSAQLKNFSVGNVKLGPNSVGPRKIIPGSVGATQVDPTQVQLRVTSSCSIGAIQSLSQTGNVTCMPALPNEYGTQPQTATLTGSRTQVATVSLPGTQTGSYMAFGTVQIVEVGGTDSQAVDVSCSMSAPGTPATQGDFDSNLGGGNATDANGTIPLVAPVSVAGSPQTLAINCTDTATPASPAPSIGVTATIHAVQTAVDDDN